MQWFSVHVSRALNTADISDVFCRWSLYDPGSSRNVVQIHDQIIFNNWVVCEYNNAHGILLTINMRSTHCDGIACFNKKKKIKIIHSVI
jgi:hypothetical protein